MRTIYTLLAGLVLGTSALARGPASPSPSAPLCTDRDVCVDAIRIDEVYFATEATGTELETHPWVELVNTREVSVQLGLFSLADASGNTTALPSVWQRCVDCSAAWSASIPRILKDGERT